MLKAVPQPGAAEVAGAVAGQRADRLKALAVSWDASDGFPAVVRPA